MVSKAEVVICGAGIGGISVAYMLTVRHGVRDVVLVSDHAPMSLTSDKSTECYRNWWPGPGDAMVQLMQRSIDLMEEIAGESANVFHLNQRGYLYTVTDPGRIADLEGFAQEASSLGAGELHLHNSPDSPYQPPQPEGFTPGISGADLITDAALIKRHFPYLSDDVVGALHVRRAGWLSAQQYGAYMLEEAKMHGAHFIEGRITGVETTAGHVSAVQLADGGQIKTSLFINAGGPLVAVVGEMLGVEIPVFHEIHQKASFNDDQGVIPRETPLVIYSQKQMLAWTTEERQMLAEDEESRWLTEEMPSGAHLRPEGGPVATTVILLWDVHDEKVPPVLPTPVDPMYPEIALRGMCRMVPGLQVYLERLPRAFIDAGYYTKTEENRPLACKLPVDGAYMIGAMSGFGIMSAAGLAELLAAQVVGTKLPAYAPAFSLDRYQDPAYMAAFEAAGDSWQL